MISWRPQGPWVWPVIAAVLVLVLIAGSPVDAATRIVPLGDSLTKSMVDTDDGDVHPSYRYWLWEKLVDNGYDVDFVGSSTSPRFDGYDFDRGNEGHGGYRIGDIVDGVDGEGRLSSWLKGYRPDIALVLIGTNDVLWDTPMDERFSGLDQIVETLRDRNPEVAIFVGKLPPTGDPVRNEEQGLLEFNGRLPGWASDESTPDSPVRVVDLYSGYDGRDDNQEPRYLHPDESGERKIANRWYSAIRDYVEGGDGEETPTPTPSPSPTPTATATPTPTPTESPTATGTIPPGATYGAARAEYVSAAGSWSRAWGASDMALIRQYLNQARTAYTTCLDTANQAVDPANAANLAVIRSVSDAYVDLADAALAMYDGADLFGVGRSQMSAGTYAAAAASFGSAADKFTSSQTLFTGATITLQGVSYAGTEYGDGMAYTAMILPLLNGKAAYMGEYAVYARGWQHAALAYQAGVGGDGTTFRNEATQAMNLFAGLQMSPSFGADAISNHNILAGLLGGTTSPTIATTVAPAWTAGGANPTPWGFGPRRTVGWSIAAAE